MLTYTKIATVTVGAGGTATIDFSNIPQTFTDLKIVTSIRTNNTGVRVRFNGDTGTNYSWRRLDGSGSAAFSDSNTTYGSPYNTFAYWSMHNTTSDTANTFSNGELYVPNYSGSNYKSVSADAVQENNATAAYMAMQAGLWSSTAAINQITLTPDASSSPLFQQYSTATLYGVGSYSTSRDYAPSSIPSTLRVGDTITIPYTGAAQTITLPAGINTVGIACYGAAGGGSGTVVGASGGYAYGIYPLNNAPLTMYAYVGGVGSARAGSGGGSGTIAGGFNGGGASRYAPNDGTWYYAGSAGGGATDIRIGGTALSNRVIVAGGGGGVAGGVGGAGGYPSGVQGWPPTYETYNGQGGFGGSQSAGGTGGTGSNSGHGVSGTLGNGGAGGNDNNTYGQGGGGGGGYYGGGGGGGHGNGTGGGGGGGSSYIGSLVGTIVGNAGTTGNGVIKITVLS